LEVEYQINLKYIAYRVDLTFLNTNGLKMISLKSFINQNCA